MKLAWQNIVHDRARFSVTVLGVSFAVFLMVFQGSLLPGFLRAALRFIEHSLVSPFCLLPTEMRLVIWRLVLKRPCMSSCVSTGDIPYRTCSRASGCVFQRSMFSRGMNLHANLAPTGPLEPGPGARF